MKALGTTDRRDVPEIIVTDSTATAGRDVSTVKGHHRPDLRDKEPYLDSEPLRRPGRCELGTVIAKDWGVSTNRLASSNWPA
jgi:hypothetical protein